MVTTATHDTKRGEDARMRLALLSEMPREWGRRVAQWLRLNRSRRSEVEDEVVPDRNVEYLFYQTLLGAWPPGLEPGDTEGTRRLAERIEAYMIKAVREGKQKSSWSNPNTALLSSNRSRRVPALAEPASGTAVVIRGVPVIRATPIVIGDTGLELYPRVCRMWDKGRTKGEGHKG